MTIEMILAFLSAHVHDIMFGVAVICGAVFHYIKKRYRNEITDKFLEYWFFNEVGNSFGTFGAMIAVIATAVGAGSLEGARFDLILGSGLLAGYSVDSAINKGTPTSTGST